MQAIPELISGKEDFNLPNDVISKIIGLIDVKDHANLISASDQIAKLYTSGLTQSPTDAEKWGFFIMKLMFKEVQRFMKQEEDPRKKRKPQVVQKYSLYTENDNIEFKTLTIYVNNSECGCRIYRKNVGTD